MKLQVVTPPEPIAVLADALRLKQVLANLVSNAIKYNRPGGEVVVESALAGKAVIIKVSDSGMGIPADRLAGLFEPFDRLGREALAIEGAGLGLALAKRLVQAMGGEIAVESQAEVGSTFTVRLPAAAAGDISEHGAPPETEPPARYGATAVILYIEDNHSNIRLMRHVADALGGLELHVADHPRDGLEAAERLQPDLILLDINLPDMDGFEVKARLNASPVTARIPVVALSANVLPETIARGEQAGFNGYLPKPLSIPALAEAIRDAVAMRPEGLREPATAQSVT